jgi:hypothetical protein
LLISYLPTAARNTAHTGGWDGDPHDELKVRVGSPIQAVVGNTIMIAAGALEPPLCPVAGAKALFRSFEQTAFVGWLREKYPRFDVAWGELPSEEGSGLGLGLTVLAVASLFGGRGRSRAAGAPGGGWWIGMASLVACVAYLAKVGSEASARLASPYYPFILIPWLLAFGNDLVVRQRWWRVLAVLVALSILPAVILTPSRPLWPAQSVLDHLASKLPDNALVRRSRLVYEVYARRDDDVGVLKPLLPSDGRLVGYVPEDNGIEAPLWKPYGSRTIVDVLPPNSDLSHLEGSAIIGPSKAIEKWFGLSPEDFAREVGGHITGKASLYVKVSTGAEEWVVIALDGKREKMVP